jgi:diguanylate cyclase (GGDEF)-like protein
LKGFPLRLVLVVPFVLQIVGAVGLVGYLSFKNGQEAVNDLADRLIDKSDRLVTERLNNYLETPQKINQINVDAIKLGLLDLKDFKTAGHYFWKQLQAYPDITYISYALPTGEYAGAGRFLANKGVTIDEISAATNWKNYTYTTDDRGNRTKVEVIYDDYRPLQEAAYQETVKAKKTIWIKPYNWDGETSAGYISISASTPIYNDRQQLMGIIGVDLLLDSINSFLQQLQISPTAKIFIIERDGLLIGSSSTEKSFTIVNGVARRLSAKNSSDEQIQATTQYLQQKFGNFPAIQNRQKFDFQLEGKHQFVRVTPWQDKYGLDWLVITTIPESDFITQINANTQTTILLCSMALLAAIGLGLITSRWITQPILLLGKASAAISQGKFDRQVKVNNIIELAVLFDSFNQMAQQLQSSFANLAQNNIELETRVEERTIELQQVIAKLQQEIAQHQATQQQLLHQSLHDALTGLPNRTLFVEHLQKAIQYSHRNPDYIFAVLFIDLDRFKIINDSWGHAVGDRLLIAIARILKECCREVDTVARLSGDEFTILLADLQYFQDAIAVAERLLEKLTPPIDLDERQVFAGASIGIVLGGIHYQNSIDLIRDADIAMYRAKTLGKGRYAVFDREMYDRTLYLSQLETDLRLALQQNEFLLYYQPIVSLETMQLIGFEALLRWDHPTKGLISPGEFIHIAEDTGLIVPIGEWILRAACQQLYTWQQQFSLVSSLHISVNLSSKQLKQFDFVDKLRKILTDTRLNGENLRLELTETMLMDRGESTIELLDRIKQQKVRLSIDDFGTGYSSLSYLHRFPIDTLKLDRSFVSLINSEGKNCEIVNTIITLAHSLGMSAIAEGVETSEQLTHLKNLGCNAAQGYFFAKPLNLQLAESLILDNFNFQI